MYQFEAALLFVLVQSGATFNVNPAQNAHISPPSPYPSKDSVPGYFGYKLILDSSRLIIGAPKVIDAANLQQQGMANSSTPAKGGIFNCRLTSVFDNTTSSGSCTSISNPNSSPGDSFGQTIGRSPSGALTACSPAKVQECSTVNYLPGYCYNRVNRGWATDQKTSNTRCSFLNMDMFLLLDGSYSLGLENFNQIKAWSKNVVSNFDLSTGHTQIGVIEFSKYYPSQDDLRQSAIKAYVRLGDCRDHTCFNAGVDRMRWFQSETDTSSALNITVKNFMLSKRFNDPSVAKVLVLLTDGASTDSEYLKETTDYVRSLGITTFAVGVGKADVNELKLIATGTNTNDRVFYVSNFTDLDSVVGTLRTQIRKLSLEGEVTTAGSSSFDVEMGEYGSSIHYSQLGVASGFRITQDCLTNGATFLELLRRKRCLHKQ